MNFSKVIFNRLSTTIIHLLFWIGVYFFFTYFLGYGTRNTVYVNRFALFLMPITISISYFFLFFLLPKYLFQKKQFLFVVYTIYTFIISFYFIILSILYAIIFSYELTTKDASPLTKTLPFIVFIIYFIVFVVISIGLIINNYKSTLKNDALKNKFLQTQLALKEQELKFLKLQIHPHFLFNTLNTLYGFALKKSDDAPEMILKLSNLLDYILYQVEKPLVLLKDEIHHIEDYISLEKLRFQDSLQINFRKQVTDENILIAPMLLLPFVENAFKHGVHIHNILWIDIQIYTIEDSLYLIIKNSSKRKTQTKKGIGLENINKRLKMLLKDNFKLTIEETENYFSVQLILFLNNE